MTKIKLENQKRNRKIPDPAIGFYGTGLYGLDENEVSALGSIINPVAKYLNSSLIKYPPHVSCRYLGYKDEVKFERIEKILPELIEIYKKLLPIKCSLGELFASWEKDPDYEPKLIMVKVISPELKPLHNKILECTRNFPIFSEVESGNFNPHFTLGILKQEFKDVIPEEVNKFIKNAEIKSSEIYLRKAYFHSEKKKGFKELSL